MVALFILVLEYTGKSAVVQWQGEHSVQTVYSCTAVLCALNMYICTAVLWALNMFRCTGVQFALITQRCTDVHFSSSQYKFLLIQETVS